MGLSEFQLIDRIFAARAGSRDDVLLGIGDDAALLRVPDGLVLATAVDGLHAGVHFPADSAPEAIGHKALAVNLSDLAAMGAEPAWATLFLSLPEADERFAAAFADGFFALAERHGVALVGGDTVRGPLTVVVQVHGFVRPGRALTRAGARPGDAIYVSGSLGDAGAGLAAAQGRLAAPSADAALLRRRLDYPQPRLALGEALGGIASAAIDISDGLVADLGHILQCSGVGARVEVERLPLSAALRRTVSGTDALELALSAGDDYELCFTVPERHSARLGAAVDGCPIARIGTIESEAGLRLVRDDGSAFAVHGASYDHFAGGERG